MSRFFIYLLSTILLTGSVFAKTSQNSTTVSVDRIDSGLELRKIKRLGTGVVVGGTTGLVGLNVELNFTPTSSVVTGVGLGSEFQTFSFAWKEVLAGQWFLPYMSGGYSRWYNTSKRGSIGKTSPGFLADRFLSPKQKASGEFAKDLLSVGFGLQYVQLTGQWIGTSLFLEATLLMDVIDMVSVPVGTMGFLIYF
jgi:hypothetical protein